MRRRATIEIEALRRVAEATEDEHAKRAARQRSYLQDLPAHVDLDILASADMWH